MQKIALMISLSLLVGCSGSDGPPGPPGADGVTVTSNQLCSQIANGRLFAYQLIAFSSGDVLVLCSISDAAAQYSGHAFYLDGQPGAAVGVCFVTYDIDSFTGGFWQFRRDGGTKSAAYTDTSSASNGAIVSLTNCAG